MQPTPHRNTATAVRQPQQRAGQRKHCHHPPVYHPPVHGLTEHVVHGKAPVTGQGQYQLPEHGHGQAPAGQYQETLKGHVETVNLRGQGKGRNEGHSVLW
jgi:hypothetical protein